MISRPPTEFEEQIAKNLVHCCIKIHKEMGPGLLEKVYEACLEYELKKLDYDVKRQLHIPIVYDNMIFDEGLRLDLLIEEAVIVEIKAIETVNPVWEAQVISHLSYWIKNWGFW